MHRRNIGISKTLCWNAERTRFYFSDTLANTIYAYRYDNDSGEINDEEVFFAGDPRGLPDGSAIDCEGFVWNCRYDGGCIIRISPRGRIDRIIKAPTRNVTTCTFGGPDLKTLYVTTAAIDRDPHDQLAGSLFALKADVPGLPENRVKLP